MCVGGGGVVGDVENYILYMHFPTGCGACLEVVNNVR